MKCQHHIHHNLLFTVTLFTKVSPFPPSSDSPSFSSSLANPNSSSDEEKTVLSTAPEYERKSMINEIVRRMCSKKVRS